MPGQEKIVMEFYQKNPQALASLRGTVYEEKIINQIKKRAKSNKKVISKEEAEKILKEHQKQENDHNQEHDHKEEKKAKESESKKEKSDKKKNKNKDKKVKKEEEEKKEGEEKKDKQEKNGI